MGVSSELAKELVSLTSTVPVKRRNCLMLGNQDVALTQAQWHKVIKSPLPPHAVPSLMVSGKQLFKDLGFRTVRSLDFAEWEGADVIWDLNSNEAVPPRIFGRIRPHL